MKKKLTETRNDKRRPEYNLGEVLKGGVPGKYAGRYQEGANIVLLAGDVAQAFPNDAAVNEALRLVIQLTKLPKSKKSRISKHSAP